MQELDVDAFLKRKDEIRNLVDEFPGNIHETVWEQSVRYGKLAYKTFQLMFPKEDFITWIDLKEESRLAWIEVGNQLERITLKENT